MFTGYRMLMQWYLHSPRSEAVLQPPVDRNEQVAAIRRLEAQTGIMAPAAAKEITGGARAEWGSSMSRGEGWNREAFEDVVVPKRFQNVGNDTKERPSVRELRQALSKSGGLPSNKTRDNNKLRSKTIWIFWAQGEAHLAAQKQGKYGNCLVACVQKWRDLNPKWTVEVVDDARAKELSASYARFFNKGAIGQALLSDVLRLDLLNRYGGVWADVSVCPVAPLDDYIEEKLAPAGFYSLWLNHWPDEEDALRGSERAQRRECVDGHILDIRRRDLRRALDTLLRLRTQLEAHVQPLARKLVQADQHPVRAHLLARLGDRRLQAIGRKLEHVFARANACGTARSRRA